MVKSCPSGQILRKGYTRKQYTKADGTVVKAKRIAPTCVPDKGKPGKTAASRKVLPVPRKGGLGNYGYHNVKSTVAANRRASLTKAVKAEGYAPIVRRLNLISNYNKNSDPRSHKIMRSDMAWMKKNLAPIYSKSMSNKPSKKAVGKASKAATKTSGIAKMAPRVIDGKSRVVYKDLKTKRKFYRVKSSNGTFRRKYIS